MKILMIFSVGLIRRPRLLLALISSSMALFLSLPSVQCPPSLAVGYCSRWRIRWVLTRVDHPPAADFELKKALMATTDRFFIAALQSSA